MSSTKLENYTNGFDQNRSDFVFHCPFQNEIRGDSAKLKSSHENLSTKIEKQNH